MGDVLLFIFDRWVKRLWMMELAMTHVGRGIDHCDADLQVPVIYGFLFECILTCLCRLMSRGLGELEPKFASAIDSFFGTSMVIVGKFMELTFCRHLTTKILFFSAFNYSGGYFNPALATGLKWGCKGHSHAEHIVVYWAGSILGSMLSIKLWNLPSFKDNFVKQLTILKPTIEEKIQDKVEELKSESEKKED